MAIKIITDSTFDISLENAKKLGIEIVPLKVTIDDETYYDKTELTNEEFYHKLKNAKEIPFTTLVSPQEFCDVFEKYPDDDILGFFISSKLSGTFQSATIAKTELDRDNIYLIDSKSATCGAALLVKMALDMISEGKSACEIKEELDKISSNIEIYAIFDTLKYLVKGGRLSNSAGAIGTLLGIKPILKIKDGVIESVAKERGFQRAMSKLMNIIDENCEIDAEKPLSFGHTNNPKELETLKSNISIDGEVFDIGSVIGTHAGPGAVAVAFFNKKN